LKDPVRVSAYNREYHKRNRDKAAARNKKWRELNAEKSISRCREWRASNQEKYREYYLKYSMENREKLRDSTRERRAKDPAGAALMSRRAELKRYGITIEEFDQVLALQGGRCANYGCLQVLTSGNGKYSAHVDHDHETNRFRAILCGSCNRGFGQLRESESVMRGLIEYKRKHSKG
jgi:hypothetical protein